MNEGMTVSLVLISFFVGICGFFVSKQVFSCRASFLIVFIKILIPFSYFCFFYNLNWNFIDDLEYFKRSQELIMSGNNPFTVFSDYVGREKLFTISRGQHILYVWWNMLAHYFFGCFYYSPVFLNVLLTFICGFFLNRIALLCGFGGRYASILMLVFLFHWDVLVWSSLINLKGLMVMTLTILSFYFALKLSSKISSLVSWVGLIISLTAFIWVRFYIPIVILSAIFCWAALQKKGYIRFLGISLSLGGMFFVVSYLGGGSLFFYTKDFVFKIYGVVRMTLTPQPWNIEHRYTFLVVPSILHWIFYIPMLFGGVFLWKESQRARALLIYLVLIFILYGSYGELQGPRHRLQVVFIIAWMQFHFVWQVFNLNNFFEQRTRRIVCEQ